MERMEWYALLSAAKQNHVCAFVVVQIHHVSIFRHRDGRWHTEVKDHMFWTVLDLLASLHYDLDLSAEQAAKPKRERSCSANPPLPIHDEYVGACGWRHSLDTIEIFTKTNF